MKLRNVSLCTMFFLAFVNVAFGSAVLTTQDYVDGNNALDEKLSNKLNGSSTSGQKIGDLTAGSAAGQDQVMYPSAAAVKEYAVKIAQGAGTNSVNVGKTLVVNSSGNLELGMPAAANYVEDSITDGVTAKAPSENAVHDELANKQDTLRGSAWVNGEEKVAFYTLHASDEDDGSDIRRMLLDIDGLSVESGSIINYVLGDDPVDLIDDIEKSIRRLTWNGEPEDDIFHAVPSVGTMNSFISNAVGTRVRIAQGAGTNNANVGKTLVVNSSGNLELGMPAAANYVEDSITDGVTTKAPSENAVHDALANKQTLLHANNSTRYPNGSLVEYGTNDGVPIARKIVTGLNAGNTSSTDIPTEGAVVSALEGKQDILTCSQYIANAQQTDANCLIWSWASCLQNGAECREDSNCCDGRCILQKGRYICE